jgi:predicted ATPase
VFFGITVKNQFVSSMIVRPSRRDPVGSLLRMTSGLRSSLVVMVRSELQKSVSKHAQIPRSGHAMTSTLEDGYQPSVVANPACRAVVITGCSGGGKSTLLAELARRGHRVFPEAGRQIVREQDWIGGDALPWSAPLKFAELVLSRGLHQRITAAAGEGLAFFDRSIVEPLCGLERHGLPAPDHFRKAAALCRYDRTVFVAPPWPEIFRGDAERRHGFEAAVAEYGPLTAAYERLGYRLVELPKTSVATRADFVLATLAASAGSPGDTH